MDPALVVALVALVVALAGVAIVVHRSWRRPSTLPTGGAVIVCTRRPDDQSFHGVVLADLPAGVRLAAANYLPASGDPVPVGEVFVPRESIAFVQVGVAPLPVRSAADAPVEAPARGPIPLPDTSRPALLREVPTAVEG